MKFYSLAIFIVVLLVAASAFAEVEIGSGFTCEGSSILRNDREVSYKKARSTILRTIEKLKARLETASPKEKAAIRERIKELNNDKKELKACSSGNLDPNQVDSLFTQLAAGSGTYTGDYSGVVDGFIPLSGTITLNFILDGTNFSTLLSLGGNLGSALNAEPLSFTGDVGGIGFPAQFNLPDTFLGSVTLSFTQAGHLTITNSGSTNATVQFEGDFSSQTIAGTLNGVYSGHTFEGSATLNRSGT